MSDSQQPSSIQERMAAEAEAVTAVMGDLLPLHDTPERVLFDAMRYGTLGAGKRLRPFLVLATANLFAVPRSRALRAAAAVEMVHAYSLIHDDLPAMDDADTRRGQPSVHKQYDEATAILAGDALLTLAFEVLAHPGTHEDASVRCALVSGLAKAAGMNGMVGGQMLDLLAEKKGGDAASITRLQRLKTGEMFAFSVEAGAILGRTDRAHHAALRAYAHDLGLAFQIVDDLLDAEGDPALTGKPVGADAAAGKATFVSLLGLERAREQAQHLARQAKAHLDVFEDRAQALKDVLDFIVNRKS